MPAPRKGYLDELVQLRDRVHAAVEEALMRSSLPQGLSAPPGSWAPAVDVVETARAFVLSAELPGVAREDVDLSIDGQRLELSGRRPLPADPKFSQMERSYGPFRRAFELPAEIDAGTVTAELALGVLTVTVPKKSAGRNVVVAETP
ncbi:MAG TPA: Hsp20/alpha crystallin family protein [Thermoanaerobaculia bacterium]|nr:Hsp20/alpha crystallin family protein [Thermoanaerobaculia bacterium]